jgi:predicted SAM-dependent methyltransferase
MSNAMQIAPSHAPEVMRRRLLHVGCGPPSAHRLHAAFRDEKEWQEIRLDIDENVNPDIVCSTVDMSSSVAGCSVDAIWSSHTIEHLYDYEVSAAFAEFLRVLTPDGFLLLRCPDLVAVAESLLRDGIENTAYESPAGSITPLDMLFGFRPAVAAGNHFMAHRTGFTDERVSRMLLEAGFAEVRTKNDGAYDLWVVAFASRADIDGCTARLARHGIDFGT